MIRIPRSTYYARKTSESTRAKADADLRDRLEELALSFPGTDTAAWPRSFGERNGSSTGSGSCG